MIHTVSNSIAYISIIYTIADNVYRFERQIDHSVAFKACLLNTCPDACIRVFTWADKYYDYVWDQKGSKVVKVKSAKQ